jgi:hypothetical protein
LGISNESPDRRAVSARRLFGISDDGRQYKAEASGSEWANDLQRTVRMSAGSAWLSH